jgi:putative holliday junction resolvase
MIIKKTLSIDYGTRRIGLALSDPLAIIASPYKTLHVKTKEQALKALLEEIDSLSIHTIVIGYPLLLNGKVGEMAKEVQWLQTELKKQITIPIHLFDERFTSKLSESILKEQSYNRKQRAQKSDTSSAALILQNWLDKNIVDN